MATLAEIRAKLLQQQERSDNRGQGTGDNAIFPFWNAPDGSTSLIRFLPDADQENVYFWVERLVIKLPFQGVKGEHDREILVQVPCMEMFGESCPILSETRAWWKDPSLESLARKYWKKRSYLFNGFVVNSAVDEPSVPENPIRRFAINSSIFDIIKSSLMNPEMEDLPIHYENGRDFLLKRTKKGEYANYSTSNWSFKTRPLSDNEQQAIEKHGPFNLKEYLPKKPNAEELAIIKEMFQASVDDQAYDPARWGNYFKPSGGGNDSNKQVGSGTSNFRANTQTTTRNVVAKPEVVESSDDEVDQISSTASSALARLQAKSQSSTVTEPSSDKNALTKELLQRLNKNKA